MLEQYDVPLLYKFQGGCPDAIPDLGRGSGILKQVAQVLLALAAQELDAEPAICIEWVVRHVLSYLFPKAGETRADIELCPCLKQFVPAVAAGIGPLLFRVQLLAGVYLLVARHTFFNNISSYILVLTGVAGL
ncbi:hypothetical protein OB13_02765 [Pontibacter sp. HJ8]